MLGKQMQNELTTLDYWSEQWADTPIPTYDLKDPYFEARHKLFTAVLHRLKEYKERRLRVLDVGCGNGLMLRFLKEQFDLDVFGIDYSESWRQAKEMAGSLDLEIHVGHMDFMKDDVVEQFGEFDVVATFGVVEHFRDPILPLKRLRDMLVNGGCLVTLVPNFHGVFNRLWKLYDSENYLLHKPVTVRQLDSYYQQLLLVDRRLWRFGRYRLPGLHDVSSGWQRVLAAAVNCLNRNVFSRFPAPSEMMSGQKVGMVPEVAIVGYLRRTT